MQAASQQDLTQAVMRLLLTATNKACLAEILRFLIAAAKGPSHYVWLNLLRDSPSALPRIIWMTDNTLDKLLFER